MTPELERALAEATAVRFLCTGNMVRSAFAELYARHAGCPVPVDSGATVYQNQGLFPETRAALRELGVEEAALDAFRPRHVSRIPDPPDPRLVVFGMTREHLAVWRALHPGHERAFRLAELVGERRNIADPVLEGASFEGAFAAVRRCVDALLAALAERG